MRQRVFNLRLTDPVDLPIGGSAGLFFPLRELPFKEFPVSGKGTV